MEVTAARLRVWFVAVACTFTVVVLISMASCYSFIFNGLGIPVPRQKAMPSSGSSLEPRPPPMMGYVIADSYGDQLSGAIRGYYQLAEIASHWNLKIVEPHINMGKLSGLKGLPINRRASLKYEDLFNISEVYRELDRCLGLARHKLVTSLEDFLVNATMRQVVVLVFSTKKNKIQVPKNKHIFNCSGGDELFPVDKRLNNYLEEDDEIRCDAIAHFGEWYRFKVVHTICVNSQNFSIHHVEKELLNFAKRQSQSVGRVLSELTVVIPVWRSISPNSPKDFYFRDPDYTWKLSGQCNSFTIPHGKMVLHAADDFSQSLDVLRPILCIHIRIEALAFKEPTNKGFWQTCVEKLEPTIQGLKSKYNLTTRNIVAIHDMGKYGSGTALSCSLCHHIKTKVLSILDRLGIRVSQYEPMKFSRPANTGFVSLVEMEFLSRSDYLITIGVGSYQRSLIAKFLKTHSEDNLHSIGFRELAKG